MAVPLHVTFQKLVTDSDLTEWGMNSASFLLRKDASIELQTHEHNNRCRLVAGWMGGLVGV